MTTLVAVRDTQDGATFMVRVTPRASRTAIAGVTGEGIDAALKIALHAPPIEGRANTALIEFLSDLLGTPRSAIEIAGGQHGRSKRIIVHGRSPTEVAPAIEKALSAEKK
jgi:uncharacterized protein (TIGR00251 family)